MKPPPDDDPTVEEEVPEFDGTSTDQLDGRYRVVVAVKSEASPSGTDRHAPAPAPTPTAVCDLLTAAPAKDVEGN